MPESSSRRVLLSVQEPRKTTSAGWKHSSPLASTYCTPVARFAVLSKTIRRTEQLFRSETLFSLATSGSSVLVGWAFAPIMQPKRSQNPQYEQPGRETPSGLMYGTLGVAAGLGYG